MEGENDEGKVWEVLRKNDGKIIATRTDGLVRVKGEKDP